MILLCTQVKHPEKMDHNEFEIGDGDVVSFKVMSLIVLVVFALGFILSLRKQLT